MCVSYKCLFIYSSLPPHHWNSPFVIHLWVIHTSFTCLLFATFIFWLSVWLSNSLNLCSLLLHLLYYTELIEFSDGDNDWSSDMSNHFILVEQIKATSKEISKQKNSDQSKIVSFLQFILINKPGNNTQKYTLSIKNIMMRQINVYINLTTGYWKLNPKLLKFQKTLKKTVSYPQKAIFV